MSNEKFSSQQTGISIFFLDKFSEPSISRFSIIFFKFLKFVFFKSKDMINLL